jgi:hypothetical protein
MFIKLHKPGQDASGYSERLVRMLQRLDLAHSRFYAAKVDSFTILSKEMLGGAGSGAPLRMSLGQSIHQLRLAVNDIQTLVANMHADGYVDPPNKRAFDFDQFSEVVVGGSLSDKSALDFATGTVEHTSFYQAFAYLEKEAEYLIELTEGLQATVAGLSESVIRAGCLARVVGENGAGNVTAPFAELQTAWGLFSSRTNAFVVLSTELSYDYNRTGSLASGTEMKSAAA